MSTLVLTIVLCYLLARPMPAEGVAALLRGGIRMVSAGDPVASSDRRSGVPDAGA